MGSDMNQVTSLGVYIVAFLAALLIAARWLLKNDPSLRGEEPPDAGRIAPQRPD